MYQINVSLFISRKKSLPLVSYLRTEWIPQVRRDAGVAQVSLLHLMVPDVYVEEGDCSTEDDVWTIVIALCERVDLDRYLASKLAERLVLLRASFGEMLLYNVSPMKVLEV